MAAVLLMYPLCTYAVRTAKRGYNYGLSVFCPSLQIHFWEITSPFFPTSYFLTGINTGCTQAILLAEI